MSVQERLLLADASSRDGALSIDSVEKVGQPKLPDH
jgi:hypothetical protein